GNPSGLVAQDTFTDGTVGHVSNTIVVSTAAGSCTSTPAAKVVVGNEYCGQTTIVDISGSGTTALSMRWFRPNGSFACGAGFPQVVAGNSYASKCLLDVTSTATADWLFQVVLPDGSAVLASIPVHVVPANTPPVANGDSYSASEDVGLSIPAPGILGNDTD